MIRIFERTSITDHTFVNVVGDSTGGGELQIANVTPTTHSGILRAIAVSCDSTDFDVSIRQKSNGQANTPDEIYRYTSGNRYFSVDDLYQGWVNGDSPRAAKLYFVLTNNDSPNGTGTVMVQLTNSIEKRFKRVGK